MLQVSHRFTLANLQRQAAISDGRSECRPSLFLIGERSSNRKGGLNGDAPRPQMVDGNVALPADVETQNPALLLLFFLG